jgi:Fe2+ transport system protein B
MNPKRETVIVVIVCVLCGCVTPKTVTETVVEHVHDTVEVVKSDTVREVKVQTVKDTTFQKEVHTYTINDVGDTVKEIHHYVEREKVIVVDSTDRYKAVVDSLRKALHEQQSKEKVVVKTKRVIRWWEYVFFLAIIGTIIFFVIKGGGKTYVDKV